MDIAECLHCNNPVMRRMHAVQCDNCQGWQHRKCQTGITADIYKEIVKGNIDFPRTCARCTDSFKYTLKREKQGFAYWICSVHNKNMRCPAQVKQFGSSFISGGRLHIHLADPRGHWSDDGKRNGEEGSSVPCGKYSGRNYEDNSHRQ